jgi:acyl carrier protein
MDIIENTQKICAKNNIKNFNKTATFKELGVDSLTGIGIIMDLENEFGVQIDDKVLSDLKDIPSLIKVFQEAVNNKQS